MGEYQRDAFLEAFDVDERAETACVRRLITGEEECHTRRSKPTTTRTAHRTRRLPPTTPRCGSTTVSQRCTRCTSTPATSNSLRRRSRRTTSGSTSSSSPRRGGWKCRFCRSPSIISGARCRSCSTRPSGTANHVLWVCRG
jgi:hypothetical protein